MNTWFDTAMAVRNVRILGRAVRTALMCWFVTAVGGCAAITNPVADGIPVRRLAPELLVESKDALQPIPLSQLRQPPPATYLLASGDVLGVWIEGVLGTSNQSPPVTFGEPGQSQPAIGYPIPVMEDGSLHLPYIAPVKVSGLSLTEAENAIREAYTKKKQILQPGRERILVTLQRPRHYSVLVIREESTGVATGTSGPLGTSTQIGNIKRGTGQVVELPAYQNDVLHALTKTGGLPGLDAKNEVVVLRSPTRGQQDPSAMLDELQRVRPKASAQDEGAATRIIRIPLRVHPDEETSIRPQDIILRDGDIVAIQARDNEYYYTGGLLGAREVALPRDRDVNVVQAIAQVNGPLVNGAFSQNNLSGTIQPSGIGFPSPSQVTVLRRVGGSRQVAIHVDLSQALQDPRENILIQAGDVIVLQNSMGEAFAQYFTSVFRLNGVFTLLRQRDAIITSDVNLP